MSYFYLWKRILTVPLQERQLTIRGLSVQFSIHTKKQFIIIISTNPHHDIVINTIFIAFYIIKAIIVVYRAVVTTCRGSNIATKIHDVYCNVFRIID